MRKTISKAIRLFIILAFSASPALSQSNSFDSGTPAESRSGLVTHSSYAQDKIETVNLANGNLSVNIPLVTIGGRGSASYTVALSYNSKLWTGQAFKDFNDEFHSGVSFDDGLNSSPNRIAIGCGWFISKGPVIKTKKVNIDPIISGQGAGNYLYVLTKVWLVLPDGSEVELRDNLFDGQPGATPPPMHLPTDRNRGRAWHSTDGSAITYVTTASNGVVNNQLGGFVYLSDGIRMEINNNGKCEKIIDRNGNELDIDYNGGAVTYTDNLGRQVTVQGGTGGATVTVNGYNGVPARTINIITSQIVGASNNLRSDFQSLPRPIISGDYANGVDHFVFGNNPHTDVFVHSDMAATNVGGSGGYIQIDTQTTVTRLDLLDGRSFRFRYNQFGELAEIVYPGGGVSQIDYVALGSTLCEGWTELNPQLNRGVSQRRSLSNGTATDATWEYIRSTGTVDGLSYPTVTVKIHQGGVAGATLMDEKHYFKALNAQYLTCTVRRSNGTGYDKFENNREFRVERQTGVGTEVESRVWAQRAAVIWQQPGYATQQPPNDPRVIQEDTILENGKMKRMDYTYDGFNNVTMTKEYDWGTSGTPGPLLRQTERMYVGSLNGNCYTSLNGISSDCSNTTVPDNPEKVIHKRRLVASETISDGSSHIESYVEYEYDNYVDDEGDHAPLISNPGMFQYDATWFDPFDVRFQPRGNITRAKRLISGNVATGAYTITYNQYDEAGNVVKSFLPNGNITNTTTISYTDNFGDGSDPDTAQFTPPAATFAMPTLVTNALGQEVKTQYDYTRGIASGVRDVNLVITKSEFDLYDRPTVVKAAYNQPEETRTEMSYPTATANESKVSNQLDATRWLTSRTQFDGFGRPILSSQSEDGNHFSIPSISYTIHTKTIYDGIGRAVKTSNPYRATAAATDGWTRAAYDIAGRVIDITTFTGDSNSPPPDYPSTTNSTGSVVTTYNGEVTTVRDQANKQRRSTVDALGRLKLVEELNEFPTMTPYAATGYTYDARGNLLTVTQAQTPTTQTRRFAYDLLSRLIFAANPEQNTSTNSIFTHNLQQWAVKYLYDLASNLTSRIDSRTTESQDPQFVTGSYQYDALNRLTQRSYNDSTPQVNFVYDTATNGKGRMASATASGVSTYTYTAYDKLGRPTAYNQLTEGQTYLMENSYNKAGLVMTQKYPSTKVMQYEYDAAGRPVGVKKQTASFYYAGAAATDATNRLQYTAHGAVTVMKLGNNLWEHTNYNSRLQPTQIGLGTSQTSTSVLALDYGYGISGSLDPTKNNGNLDSQTITTPTGVFKQNYAYDALNRLTIAQERFSSKLRWTQTYSYDRWGNRTGLVNTGTDAPLLPSQYTPDVDPATNRFVGAIYDEAGNMTVSPPPHTLSFRYDAENRLKSSREPGALLMGYDAEGRRVKKINEETSETLVMVYDSAGQILAEYSSTSVNLPSIKVSYMTADHLGSTRVVTAENQAVKVRRDYMPFGEEIGINVSKRFSVAGYGASEGTRQKFTSKERDSESGVDYFGARYYPSTQGRFTSVDPENIGADTSDAQSWNGYAYGRNNPMKYVDPDGLTFRIYDNDGNSVDLSDDYVNRTLRNKKINPNIRLRDGKIFQGKEQIGTYTRLSFDDLKPLGNGVVSQLDRSASASLKMIGGFAAGTVILGTGGGFGIYYAGSLGTITTLNITTTAFRPLASLSLNALKSILGKTGSKLLEQWFKTGKELPSGLNKEMLQAYLEIARRAIEKYTSGAPEYRSPEGLAEQLRRVEIIEKALGLK